MKIELSFIFVASMCGCIFIVFKHFDDNVFKHLTTNILIEKYRGNTITNRFCLSQYIFPIAKKSIFIVDSEVTTKSCDL